MNGEIDKQILVDRVIEEVILPFANQKEMISVPALRQEMTEFNNKNNSDFTIWEVFRTTFTEVDSEIQPLKALDTTIKVSQMAIQDQEYAAVHDNLDDNFQDLAWARVEIAKKVINRCKSLGKKFH